LNDGHYYYAQFSGGAWPITAEPVTAGGTASSGPVAPAIAFLQAPILVFVADDGDLYDQSRIGGAWQAANAHGVTGHVASVTPCVITPSSGAELLVVYNDTFNGGLDWTARTAGAWSTPTPINGATTNEQASLAPLAGGGAVLAYRGTDGHLYTTQFLSNGSWVGPQAGVMGSDPVIATRPVVAAGAVGAEAELLYLDANLYVVYWARLVNGTWGAPSMAGASNFAPAIATGR
jgi:hypothetical protein